MTRDELIEELEQLADEWEHDVREMKANCLPDHARWTQSNLDELQGIIRRAKRE